MPRPRKVSPSNDVAVQNAIDAAIGEAETTAVSQPQQAESGLPLIDLLTRASEDQKDAIRKALGVQASVKAPQRKQSNADAQQVLAAHGGGTFQPKSFKPVPPEGVYEKGPEAVRRWLDRWENGQTFSSRQAEIEGIDAEALAATALE